MEIHTGMCVYVCVCFAQVGHALQDLPFTLLGASALPLFVPPFWVPGMKWEFEPWHHHRIIKWFMEIINT